MKDTFWHIFNKIPTEAIVIGICGLSYLLYLKGGHDTIGDLKSQGIHFCDEDGNMMKAVQI